MPCRRKLLRESRDTRRDATIAELEAALGAANEYIRELEQKTLEYAHLALELREHATRSERLSGKLQRLVA